MRVELQKEEFSKSYVRAVASVVGVSCTTPDVDDDSVDLSLASRTSGLSVGRVRLELQLKCTAGIELGEEESFSFPLSIKNYNDLRPTNLMVPRILVVCLVPTLPDEWLRHSEEMSTLHRCAYWTSLRGREETRNTSSISISISRSQQFNVGSLKEILQRLGEGGEA